MGNFPTMALDDAPSGLPPDQPEEEPLGVREDDDDCDHGPAVMPGIPSEREPPAAS
jgi:hypothetical protein